MFASDALFWNTKGSMRAQSALRQIALPPFVRFFDWMSCASDCNCAHVFGAVLIPAWLSIAVLTSIASGDQSFGKP